MIRCCGWAALLIGALPVVTGCGGSGGNGSATHAANTRGASHTATSQTTTSQTTTSHTSTAHTSTQVSSRDVAACVRAAGLPLTPLPGESGGPIVHGYRISPRKGSTVAIIVYKSASAAGGHLSGARAFFRGAGQGHGGGGAKRFGSVIVAFFGTVGGDLKTVERCAGGGDPTVSSSLSSASTTGTGTSSTTASSSVSGSSKSDAARLEPVPTALPPGAHIKRCGRITGNLGKTMQAWTVRLADGESAGCDDAITVLADYYKRRLHTLQRSPAILVDGASCNQDPKPDLPQVICVRGKQPFFSAWPQR